MSNKITITLQANTNEAKRNIANLEKDIKTLTTSIESQSELQKKHYNNIKSALNEQNKENENFAKRRQQIIQDTISSNKQLEESMKMKTNPLKEQISAMEQAKAKIQNEQKALLASLGGDTTKANEKQKEQLTKREQDLTSHINEIKRLKKELTEVTRSQDYQDLSNQISTNNKLKSEQLQKLQAEKQLYSQSSKIKIDNLKQEQSLNAQGLADNRKVLSEKEALLQKEIGIYKAKDEAIRNSLKGMSFGTTPEASQSAYITKQNQPSIQKEIQERDNLWNQISKIDRESQGKIFKDRQDYENKVLSTQKASANKQMEIDSWVREFQQSEYENKVKILNKQTLANRAALEEDKKLKEQFTRDFVNTSAQNKYNDTLARLGELESKGIITSKEKEKALLKEKIALDESEKSTSNLANTTIRYLRWAGTIAGVVYAGQRAWDMTLGKGIEVNKMIEDNTAGIAALISANTRMALSNGQIVNSYEKFQIASGKAASIMEELRVASTKTYATFPQLTGIYQQMIGHTMSMGDSMGKTVNEISTNTIELSKILSNIGGAIGMEMQKVNEEARSIISGSASTDSLIAMMVFGSPTQANQAMKKAKEAGVNGVKDMLMGVLESYKVLEGVKTYTRAQLELQDQISRSQELLSKPTYNALKDVYMELSVALKQNEKDFQVWGERLLDAGKFVIEYADDIAKLVIAYKTLQLAMGTASAFATGLGAANVAAALTFSGMAIPIGIAVTAYIAYNELIGETLEKEEKLAKIRGQKLPDLNALSSSSIQNDAKTLQTAINDIVDKRKELSTIINGDRNKWGLKYSEEDKKEAQKAYDIAGQEYNKLLEEKKAREDVLTTRENILNVANKEKKAQEEQAELLTKMGLNKKIEEDQRAFKEANEKEIVKLTKQRAEWAKDLLDTEKSLADIKAKTPNETKYILTVEEMVASKKKAILALDGKIAEVNEQATKQKTTELKQADNLNEAAATRAKLELELKALTEGTYNSATYIVDQAKVDVRLAEEKLKHLTGQDNILKASVDLGHKKLALEKAIADQKEKQDEADRKALSFAKINEQMMWKNLDTESLSQLEEGLKLTFEGDNKSLVALQKQVDKVRKEIYKEPLILDIKFDGFDEVSNGIAEIGNSFQDMQKEAAKYNRVLKDNQADEKDRKQAQLDYSNVTITGYSNMIGAMASFYDEDDSRQKKQLELQKFMNATKMAMQLAELAQTITVETAKGQVLGTNALIAQLQLPFPANIPAYAMVAAMLASLGVMVGGNTKTSTTSDAFSAQKANTGTGTVLGDTEKQSESITKALETLKDFAQPQYKTLQSMNKYLENISNSIGGVSSLLIQQGGFAFGQGATEFNTGYKNNLKTANGAFVFNPINDLIAKIPIVGQINSAFGSIINSVIGGIFGKTSVSQALKDSGITFADTLLTSAIKEFNGQSFQTIATTTTKKSLFSKSSSTSIQSYFNELDSETERQFSLVLNNLYNTTLLAGEALDSAQATTAKSLENFVVSIGKVSLKDKRGDEIQSMLESIFGSIGDNIAKTAFPLLTPFQKVGEGMFETLTRVATGMEEAKYYTDRLGKSFVSLSYTDILNKQGDVGFEALLQSITKTDEAIYGLDNNLIQIVKSLDSTAEELYGTYTALDNLRNILNFLNTDTQALSFASIRGAGGIESLASGIQAYTENFLTEQEQLALSTTLLQKEFDKLNIAMPVGKDGFTTLINSIDKTSESGQELWGKVIVLSSSFSELTESLDKLDNQVVNSNENINSFLNGFRTSENLLVITARSLQTSVAITYEQLALQFKQMSGDLNGLTDEELNYLEKAKDYIVSKNTELLNLEKDKYEAEKTSVSSILETLKTDISSIDSILSSLTSTIDSLRENADTTNTYTLNKFRNSMEETLSLIGGKNYKAIQESLQKTIGYSGALNEAKNFALSRDMKYAQLVAANQFESMDVTLQTEVDYLRMIEKNTSETVGALTAKLTQIGTDISSSNTSLSDAIKDLIKPETVPEYNKQLTESEQTVLKSFQNTLGITPDTSSGGFKYWVNELQNNPNITASNLESSIASGASSKADALKALEWFKSNGIKLGSSLLDRSYANGLLTDYEANSALDKYGIPTFTYGDSTLNSKLFPYNKFKQMNIDSGLLQSFAVGTTNVPYDMTANIHKGEIITPETYADGIRGGDLVMGKIGNITNSIERMGEIIANKIASLIIVTNNQTKILKDVYDVTNGSLASLQNIEEII